MSARYRTLVVAALIAAPALAGLARLPRRAAPRALAASTPVATADVSLVFAAGALSPERASVQKGERVRLTLENRGADTLAASLAGYQDRLRVPPLAPGARWQGEFLADRPGDEFAWLAGGRPIGRLAVTGSHLQEGHR